MTKHSRNSTASPVFSYAERQALGQGTKRQRLGKDSLRNFDSCSLCLSRARDPRCCSKGHLFCNECIIKNLVSQKKDISRQKVLLEKVAEQEENERQAARLEARERVYTEFEASQQSVSSANKPRNNNSMAADQKSTTTTALSSSGIKFNSTELDRLTKENEDAALAKIQAEQNEKRKSRLPNFWLPSLTPDAGPPKLKEAQLKTLCRVGDPTHPISLKSLITVQFTTLSANNKSSSIDTTKNGIARTEDILCSACRKALSNSTKMATLKPCGHVICLTCVDTLAKKTKQCPTCDVALPESSDIVNIHREGTGFASGGKAEASRYDVSFQC